MASVESLVTDERLSIKTFQKECECAGSDFVYEFSIEKTKVHTSKQKQFQLELLPTHYTNLKLEYYILKES